MAVTVKASVLSCALGGKTAATLSNGQIWATAVDDTGFPGQQNFFYSNDGGVTWGEDTLAKFDLGGNYDGGALFVDVDDVLWWAGWESGFGGVIKRGTISGNAITWTHRSQGTGSDDAQDVIAFPEGSDVRVFKSLENGGNISVYQHLWNATTGFSTYTLEYSQTAGAGRNTCLDFNHNGDGKTLAGDPDVWLTFLRNSTLYMVKLTWSSGPSWTPGPLRGISSDPADDINKRQCFGFWDGTRLVMGGIEAGGDIRVWERNEADTVTTDRSPGAITGQKALAVSIDGYYDDATGDIYVLMLNSSDQPGYIRYDRAANSWDSSITVIEAESVESNYLESLNWLRNEGGRIGNQMLPFWSLDAAPSDPDLRTEANVIPLSRGGGIGFWV